MGRSWNRTDTNSVKDRKTRDIFIKIDEYLIDVSKQLTALSGSGGGAGFSQSLTQGATELGVPIVSQPFLSVNTDPTMINERVIAVDTDAFTLTDGGAKGDMTIGVASPFSVLNIDTDYLTVNIATTLRGTTSINALGSGTISVGTDIQWDAAGTYDIGTDSVPTDHIYTNYLDGLCRAAPNLTLGTANAIGTTSVYIPSNSTLAVFDAVVGADIVGTASNGVNALASRSDHAHRFPTSLMEYTNSKTLALTSTATVSTLTTGTGITGLTLAGATAFRSATTNTCALGNATFRWLSGAFGTNGINVTGTSTLTGAVTFGSGTLITFPSGCTFNGDLIPATDQGASFGSPTFRFATAYVSYLTMVDQGDGTTNTGLKFVSSVAPTSEWDLTLDIANASRTLKLAGNVAFPSGSAYTVTNPTTDRAYDTNATSIDELADVLGTLIADLKTAGVIT